jgi:hypothetical protein
MTGCFKNTPGNFNSNQHHLFITTGFEKTAISSLSAFYPVEIMKG